MALKKSLLVVAKPAGNLPRMLNLAENLLECNVHVLQVGRHKAGERKIVRLGARHWVLNIKILSDRVKLPLLREFLIYLEFIIRCNALVARVDADYLFTFYNPAAVIHRFVRTADTKKIAWLLDFRHPYFLTFKNRVLEFIGESGWRYSDAIVVPTRERLALHYSRRPDCLNTRAFVVHNSPNSSDIGINRDYCTPYKDAEKKCYLRIVYAGTVGGGYGLEEIIQVVSCFEFDIHFTILGKKRYLEPGCDLKVMKDQEKIIRLIDNANYPDRIKWLDAVPYKELVSELGKYDVGYVTYPTGKNLNDRFSAPGKIYDYISAGVIPMTDEESPIAVQLAAANCGFIFPYPPDIEGIRQAVESAVHNRVHIEEMRIRLQMLFNESLSQQKQLSRLFRHLGIEKALPSALVVER